MPVGVESHPQHAERQGVSTTSDNLLFTDLLHAEQVASDAIRDAQAQHQAVLTMLRQHCPHEDLFETTWEADLSLIGSMNPVRICRTCGVEEEAQTFRILTGPAAPADRQAIYAARKMGVPARVGGSRLFTD
jgi:hypothetical protein